MDTAANADSTVQDEPVLSNSYDIPFLLDEAGWGRLPLRNLNASRDGQALDEATKIGVAESTSSAVGALGEEASLRDASGGLNSAERGAPEDGADVLRRGAGDGQLARRMASDAALEAEIRAEQNDSSVGSWAGDIVTDADVDQRTHVHEAPTRPDKAPEARVSRVDTWSDGYFPTRDDTFYIGDRDYPRSRGGASGIYPDLSAQNFTGIFPYEDPDPTFYDQYAYVFSPVDRALGFFAPHDAFVVERQSHDQGLSFVLDGGLPIFTRGYDPDRAHVKAGPLYLDLLSLGAGVLYSDYDGVSRFPAGKEDGWLSFIELQMRAVMQFSENFYLAVSGTFIYLPGENEIGFQFGNGFGPYTAAVLNFQNRVGNWDIRAYDEFRALYSTDLFWAWEDEAFDQAGRYFFGFREREGSSNYFDDDSLFLANTLGIESSRLIGTEWRLFLDAEHTDFWRTYDFSDHSYRDRMGALIGYEGSKIPFSPYFEYDAYSTDRFDTAYHTAYIGGRGRISENVRLNARAGYLWSTDVSPDEESWLWDIGLTHNLNERAWQSLWVGQGYFTDDFTSDSLVSDYARYTVGYRFADEVYATAFAQWSEDEFLTGREMGSYEREMYGADINLRPFNYTLLTSGVSLERSRALPSDDVDERTLVYAALTQQLYSRTSLWFRYQFEDSEDFDEHLYTGGIRKYF